MRAQTGMTLNTSEKTFHNFKLYFLLPELTHNYIHRRNHRSCWYWSTRDCHAAGRSFRGIWFCRQAASKYTRLIVFPGQCSRPGTGSWCLQGTLRIRIVWLSRRTGHGRRRRLWWAPQAIKAWVEIGIYPWLADRVLWFQTRAACSPCPWLRGACWLWCRRQFLSSALWKHYNLNKSHFFIFLYPRSHKFKTFNLSQQSSSSR